MKKLILLMAVIVALTCMLFACGDKSQDDTSSDTSGNTDTSGNVSTDTDTSNIACVHEYGEWSVLTEATCTAKGVDTRQCKHCGKKTSRFVDPTGHNEVVDEAVEGSCKVDGYTEGKHCSNCGLVTVAQTKIPKEDLHKYDECTRVVKEPSLSAGGEATFKCSVCDSTKNMAIDKLTSSTLNKNDIFNIEVNNPYNPAIDNIWKVVDGKTSTGGFYGPGDDWFGKVGDTLKITLGQEIVLTELKVYALGNGTYGEVIVKNAKGAVVKRSQISANSSGVVAYKVVSGGNLKAYTIEVKVTGLKWNDDPYTFKVPEVEITGAKPDLRLPHDHMYREFIKDTVLPTCQETGKAEYACFCGKTNIRTTPTIDCSFTVFQAELSKPATCTENGKNTFKCETCNSKKEVRIYAKGHIYAKLVNYISQPTSSKNGEATFKCIGCDLTSNKQIQALPLGKIEHLRVDSISGGIVTLRFNIYGELANYEVKYSADEITDDSYESATTIDATVTGNNEITVKIPLEVSINKGYYVAIKPYIGENYGEIATIRVGGNKLIPIDYHSANVYTGEVLNSFAKLFDEQASERSKAPTTQLGRIITDTGDTVLYNMLLRPIVDLEYKHYVSSAYLYYADAGSSVTVRWSDTPVDAYAEDAKWDGVYKFTAQAGWNEIKINSDTRYVQVVFKDGSAPYEMLVYGYQSGDGDKIATSIGGLPTMGEMMGMCGFVAGGGGNTPIDSVICTTVLREYHNFGWSYSVTSYPGKTSFFNTSWMADFDSQYRDYKSAGLNVIPCIQWDLVNLPQSNKVDSNNLPIKSNGKFVKSDFWGKMNPHTYFMYADGMFAFAARYGTNTSTELLNTLALHVSDRNNVGLNYLEWIELGNEPDGAWNGIHNYYSAYQLAALTSAAYDGHCRTMVSPSTGGYHLGLKNADPNMKGAMAGVSAVSNEYITALCYWMKANRPDGKVAIDAFNVHCYMSKQITLPNGQTAYVGMSPEEAGIVNTLSQLISIRNKYYPEKEVWLTEFGWDTNQSYATVNSSHAYENKNTGVSYTGRQVQAMWLTRTYLLLSAIGIDKATMYMCEDTGVEDLSIGKFYTSGVIAFEYDNAGRAVEVKKDSYYYLYTLKNVLGDYTFNQKIEAYDENVMIYEYKTAEGKTAYAVWCATSDGTVSKDYQLKIDGTSAKLVEAQYGDIDGVEARLTADSLGYVSVNVSENPIYVVVD